MWHTYGFVKRWQAYCRLSVTICIFFQKYLTVFVPGVRCYLTCHMRVIAYDKWVLYYRWQIHCVFCLNCWFLLFWQSIDVLRSWSKKTYIVVRCLLIKCNLTHWCQDKMAANFRTTILNAWPYSNTLMYYVVMIDISIQSASSKNNL